MCSLLCRIFLVYLVLLVSMRMLGKREIGQLSAIDLVLSIVIGELAAIPITDHKIPMLHGVIPIIILTLAQIGLSLLCLKSNYFRRLVYGKPNVLIANGKMQLKEMRSARYNIDDLLAQLRQCGVFDLDDVEAAVLETSGELTVVLKSMKRPLTPEDLNIKTQKEGLALTLIDDGEVNLKGLEEENLSMKWLMDTLVEHGIDSPTDVFYASLNPNGKIYIMEKEQFINKKERRIH